MSLSNYKEIGYTELMRLYANRHEIAYVSNPDVFQKVLENTKCYNSMMPSIFVEVAGFTEALTVFNTMKKYKDEKKFIVEMFDYDDLFKYTSKSTVRCSPMEDQRDGTYSVEVVLDASIGSCIFGGENGVYPDGVSIGLTDIAKELGIPMKIKYVDFSNHTDDVELEITINQDGTYTSSINIYISFEMWDYYICDVDSFHSAVLYYEDEFEKLNIKLFLLEDDFVEINNPK